MGLARIYPMHKILLVDESLTMAPWPIPQGDFDQVIRLRLSTIQAHLPLAEPADVTLFADGLSRAFTNGTLGRALKKLPAGSTYRWVHPWDSNRWHMSRYYLLPFSGPGTPIEVVSADGTENITVYLPTRRPAHRPPAPRSVDMLARMFQGLQADEAEVLALASAVKGAVDIQLLRDLFKAFGTGHPTGIDPLTFTLATSMGLFRRVSKAAVRPADDTRFTFLSPAHRRIAVGILPRTYVSQIGEFLRANLSAERAAYLGIDPNNPGYTLEELAALPE